MGAQGSTYSYNGDGTLVGQASGGVTTGYAQDLAGGQSQVLAIATGAGAGASTVDQLWGLDRLASLNPAIGARAWYGYDGQGSARQLLNDAGHVVASANYDPYGTPEGAALPSRFGYTGELTDPATGSQYLRARWYRPAQGSLLGVDPALDSTGQPYSYAGDNPANGADPSGLIPTQAEIDQLLQGVLSRGTQIVMPGNQRPPGNQPWPYFVGTTVHNAIAAHYSNENPGSVVFTNNFPLSAILRYLQGSADPAALSVKQLAFKPDIYDATYRRVYEIKPYRNFAGALVQLNLYVQAFHLAHVYMVAPGPSNAPGTSGIISAPGGYAVFASPAPGIILYRKFNGMYKPAPAHNVTCSATQVVFGLVSVVITVFGMIIDVVTSPGLSDSPALA